MSHNITAFWHRKSYDQLMTNRLPELLAERLPVAGYHFESTGTYTGCIKISLTSIDGNVKVAYTDIPQPDEEGMFKIDGENYVVVPTASTDNLKKAKIRCVGEQLYSNLKKRLKSALLDQFWEAAHVRSWLPLHEWIQQFFRDTFLAQKLEETNWLAKLTHLRRLYVLKRNKVFTPSHFGRTCPFETPEGPNIGRILTIARGAEIHEGKLVVVDKNPDASLGLASAMIPFLEHNDPPQTLMGANMMRQWMAPSSPETAPLRRAKEIPRFAAALEPALVQTGYEPDVPDFWCGRNLLTAFISWGGDTFEDGIVISESSAARLNFPCAIEPGDKIGNRHGTKGVISRILPDDDMPHLADGAPVEIVFSFGGLHARMNLGQLREAVMGRIARLEDQPAIVPPFHAPSADELRERLKKAGLPEEGMETLTLGRNGKKLQRPSTVGWVYWGRLAHIAIDKIKAFDSTNLEDHRHYQTLGELEYDRLRNASVFETLREHFNTRSMNRTDAHTLVERVAKGDVEQAGPPTPLFADLANRLAAAGIRAELNNGKLIFGFARPKGNTLKLAQPVPHPWLHDQILDGVGVREDMSEYQVLADVNARTERMLASNTPESLTRQTLKQLQMRVAEYVNALLNPTVMNFKSRSLFSGRAVIAPGAELRADQLGIPEETAWALFSPQVIKALGDAEEVRRCSQRATHTLDELMARSWVIVLRPPAHTITHLVAFHPVRHPDRVFRVHPFVCELMDANFDGDQAAVFLPITETGQREAGERLSIAGHLKHNPNLTKALVPGHDAMWGLAHLSLTPEGRSEIAEMVGTEIATPDGLVRQDSLAQALEAILKREGTERTIEVAERLMQRGLEIAKESGASMNAFISKTVGIPSVPTELDDAPAWNNHAAELAEWLASRTDFTDNNLGPQILAAKSQDARSRLHRLAFCVGARGTVSDIRGRDIIVRHGYSNGLTPEELYALSVGAREGIVRRNLERQRIELELRSDSEPTGFTVLVRAMRSKHPGIVFARAAATGEVDPLADVDSRLFVGLPVTTGE